jgi:hypothetical protein
MDWIDLAHDRDQWRALVNTVMNLRVLQKAGKFLSGCTIGSFSRRAQLLNPMKSYLNAYSVDSGIRFKSPNNMVMRMVMVSV